MRKQFSLNHDQKFLIMTVLNGLGVAALLHYYGWWLADRRYASIPLLLIFFLAFLYSAIQMLGTWLLYIQILPPKPAPAPPDNLTFDVYITSCGEPFEMVEQTLQAACRMSHPHRTWLLDDMSDPALERLAESLGAGYLTRNHRSGAKAGNLNAALPRTEGDVIAIFDIDHVPQPDFLEKTAGYFRDPQIGFVQVMLTFHNARHTWIANAASETSLEFYNPTALGTDSIGSATLMGSNALIRRRALESIGGYQPGLAEDLATSLALHAAGWRSVYVAEPLAPGIAPPDLAAWFTQQLKWARGVFELLVTAYPRRFNRLTWGQRLSYAVRMTKYWIGPAVFFHLLATILVLIFADFDARAAFHEYLDRIAPLVFIDILIRNVALRFWKHSSVPKTSLLRAISLVYATWPIYLIAWAMAVFRLRLGFQPTPKSVSGRLNPLWLAPQLVTVLLLIAGALYTVFVVGHPPSILLTVVIIQGLLQLVIFANWLSLEMDFRRRSRGRRQPAEGAALQTLPKNE